MTDRRACSREERRGQRADADSEGIKPRLGERDCTGLKSGTPQTMARAAGCLPVLSLAQR